jgi:mono/diheme cytochrome c family protein
MSLGWKALIVAITASVTLLGLTFGFGALVASMSPGPTVPRAGSNPPPADLPVARGRLAFASNCAGCHGKIGQGGMGPSLHNSDMSDTELTATITNGVPQKMPAFGKDLDAGAIHALVTYIRTLK